MNDRSVISPAVDHVLNVVFGIFAAAVCVVAAVYIVAATLQLYLAGGR